MRTKHLLLLLAAVSAAALFFELGGICCAGENDIPVQGAVYHVQRPEGSQQTYLDIVVGRSFKGRLPDDIVDITVTGPEGKLAVGREDFNYNPQWRDFWAVLPGIPKTGRYVFEVVGKNGRGSTSDIQKANRTIPLPDVSSFRPQPAAPNACPAPVFSWSKVKGPVPLYYQLQIRDMNRRHLFQTGYVRGMTDVRIPPDVLKPGHRYQWRVRVADGPDWITLDNRSQSRWMTNSRSTVLQPCAYRYSVPPKTGDGWAVSALEKEDIDPAGIAAMMQKLINGDLPTNIHSVLIVKNGRLVLEEYLNGYARNAKNNLMSASKSVTSILVGIARDQGKIAGVETRLFTYFPQYKNIRWEGLKKQIRLKDVLTMSAGLDWNSWEYRSGDIRDTSTAMARSDDWIRFTLARQALEPPGSRFVYNNGLTLLLGEIVKKATGLAADDFAAKNLFAPLDISDFTWRKTVGGIVDTAGGLRLRPRDMAKIGVMMLDGGKYKGRRIVSSAWVEDSTKAHLTEDILLGGGYGYQWWRGRVAVNGKDLKLFYAAGHGGQYIFVVPTLDLVVVFTSKTLNDAMGEFRPQILMVTSILPAMLPSAPPRPAAKIDPKIAEQYVGEYEFKTMELRLPVFRQGGTLFARPPEEELVKLIPEGNDRFVGTAERVGNFSARFFRGPDGQITHFMLQVGFGYWRFDKLK